MPGLPNIKDFTLAELEQKMVSVGLAKYRAKQVVDWFHRKGINSFAKMSNLPKETREKLAGQFSPGGLEIVDKKMSRDASTAKYLLKMADGQAVESVLMKYHYGYTACLSTQVGCRMGCALCASGLEGLMRNLTPGEIIDQIWAMQHDSGERIGRIVLMGAGEPLDNFVNTVKFLELVAAPYGLNIGCRHITLSTCGVVPRIYDLMQLRLAITLAVSLHAPNNELRNKLMPVNKVYPLEKLLPACAEYAGVTGRRVSFEYALLGGVNDSAEYAAELARVLRGIHCHVNLIPANPVPERGIRRSKAGDVKNFRAALERAGYPVTVRRELGLDIDAACGQLRRRVLADAGAARGKPGAWIRKRSGELTVP
ncbi:23S rRNA (adenine(2503)-C(2))-methyltransferase RlmN [Desulfoscipio geothermicus]|uniref:Probable dual-specificity RNA methyltransferase RlmN n=1 Tax=Desulfoscipio geothermicus DSM 3669 TaxID=1121426 RepID=A0A1I6DJ75_9FIRM|nr:23S rRNA (adenine(2503)-C(2))-methyltransferase RlmN [Desulfoscipio geothermicus]SFR05505.1 23S rRNA m(2)A-2503 methyltransferase [Desulfoscipio geothermicus DSM 3669]